MVMYRNWHVFANLCRSNPSISLGLHRRQTLLAGSRKSFPPSLRFMNSMSDSNTLKRSAENDSEVVQDESLEQSDTKRRKLSPETEDIHDNGLPTPGEPMETDAPVEDRPSRTEVKKQEPKRKKSPRRNRKGTRNSEDEVDPDRPKALRLPKRQCALLLGFCGSGYSGMQIQPNIKTIEGELFQAMVRAGAVSQDNADNPVKVNLARAARTDAGVHAAGNIVSLKMIITIPGVKDLVARLNEELPPEIRVRTQNSFNARTICDSRKYTYFFPSYLLIPPKPGSNFEGALSACAASLNPERSQEQSHLHHPFWTAPDAKSDATPEEDLARKRAWRASPEEVNKLRELAKKYLATKNFHNFTVDRDFKDRSNYRYMKKIEVGDPVVYGETEWISVMFHGQSFMLHQRKMMSGLVLCARTNTPPAILDELYKEPDVFVPKMPALGLLLEQPLFESYNRRMNTINEKLKPTDHNYRPPIDFDVYHDKMEEFKEMFIYTNMRNIEDRTALFDQWMRTVDNYSGNDLLWLNPEGIVPEQTIIIKGQRRDNPFKERRRFNATSFALDGDKVVGLADEDEEEVSLSKKDLDEMEG